MLFVFTSFSPHVSIAHLDEFKELLQVIVEDGFFQRRLERGRRRVYRLRNPTVILEYTARHSAECRRLLSSRPVYQRVYTQ